MPLSLFQRREVRGRLPVPSTACVTIGATINITTARSSAQPTHTSDRASPRITAAYQLGRPPHGVCRFRGATDSSKVASLLRLHHRYTRIS